VTVTCLSGTPDIVSFSLSLPQTLGSYTFTLQSGTPTFTSKLTITTIKTAPPGTYYLKINATGTLHTRRTGTLKLTVTAPPSLTLNLSPQTAARGSVLTISGQLTPAKAAAIRLYYRVPHETGTWGLATTLYTNVGGSYLVAATVPTWLTPGDYDLVAVWFDETTGTHAASPITLLTIT
jgi:hypothetical protein